MESEEYYKKQELNRINRIIENAEYAHEPELPKIMKDVNKGSYERLIKIVIKLNNIEDIKKETTENRRIVSDRDLDLIDEFFSLNDDNINLLDEYWLKELKLFGRRVFFEHIEIKEGYNNINKDYIKEKYYLFLKSFELLNNLKG